MRSSPIGKKIDLRLAEINDEKSYIKSNFKIRNCIKYCNSKTGNCYCGRSKSDHSVGTETNEKWSYGNNTIATECNYFGRIRFSGCDDLCTDHKFIRFDVIGNSSDQKDPLASIVETAFNLVDIYWKVPKPKLIISVIGGFKRMNITTQQKKNFKQGLIDIMKKDRTMIVTGGFNVGVHKLVSETVREFRIYHENNENRTHLIGISTWGVVWRNDILGPKEEGQNNESVFSYPNTMPKIKGKVALDPNCDCFLFCDDGTERSYDKEVDFRMKFEKYAENEGTIFQKLRASKGTKAFAVQILFEGGSRAVFRAHETLQNKISIVVLKGSGRASDLISEIMELKNVNLEKNIATIVEEYKGPLGVDEKSLTKFNECLIDMYMKYHKQIVIYDMLNSNMKFGKMIVEAIISGQTGLTLAETLTLTIRFNCSDIAQKEVFSHADYGKIDADFIKQCFLDVLKENKYEFVNFFIENDIAIEDIITIDTLNELYEESRNTRKSLCGELMNDLVTSKSNYKDPLKSISALISILSGNILENFYNDQKKCDSNPNAAQDLFLWALISGRMELAEIFWRIGKDHVSSGLIGSTILKNMAYYILKRGDSELHEKLIDSSTNFEEFALNVLSNAFNENKKKTNVILIRELKAWNNSTCFRIALSGNLLKFLSHSACRSYTTEVWMGGLSPFLSLWKILVTIPFSVCTIYYLIMPSFQQTCSRRPVKKSSIVLKPNLKYNTGSPEECNFSNEECNSAPAECNFGLEKCIVEPRDSVTDKKPISYWRAMKIFYSAPIVKFYINFATYIGFLFVFAYLNLVELQPRDKIRSVQDVGAEIFVYTYILTFLIEEVRQIKDQERTDGLHKLQAYFSGSCNKLDAFIIIVFTLTTIIRFCLLEEYFMIVRCMFSISYCMFCLRTLQFYFAYEFVGPKVIMIRNMIRDIVFFLSIFALFIVAFGTLSHSMRSPNSSLDLFLIKDVLQMPYFQTYGELMLDKLFDENACNSTNCYFQRTTVILGFAVYLLLTNILLINLLIAMFGYTFNQIQEQSGKYWLFIRLQLVEEFYMKPILSPPLNLLYYCYVFILFLARICRCQKKKPAKIDDEYDNLLLRVLPGDENIKMTGFEQICMESSVEEMQVHLADYMTKTRTENQQKQEYPEKTTFQTEQFESQEMMSIKSFQVRCDKRLERLEMSIEKLISRDSTYSP